MKCKRKESIALKAVGKLVQNEAKKVQRKWPPDCMGFLHQPKRPAKK